MEAPIIQEPSREERKPLERLTVRVEDCNGNPVPNCVVTIGEYSARTNHQGERIWENGQHADYFIQLEEGAYHFGVRLPGETEWLEFDRVCTNQETLALLTLEREAPEVSGNVEFRLKDDAGEPLAGVWLEPDDGEPVPEIGTIREPAGYTDREGRLRLTLPHAGEYTVWMYARENALVPVPDRVGRSFVFEDAGELQIVELTVTEPLPG